MALALCYAFTIVGGGLGAHLARSRAWIGAAVIAVATILCWLLQIVVGILRSVLPHGTVVFFEMHNSTITLFSMIGLTFVAGLLAKLTGWQISLVTLGAIIAGIAARILLPSLGVST